MEAYFKENDLDITMIRVREVLGNLEKEMATHLRKELDSLEEMKKFYIDSFQSLEKDVQPWKLQMYQNLESEILKKIDQKLDFGALAIKRRISEFLGAKLEEEKKKDEAKPDGELPLSWLERDFE